MLTIYGLMKFWAGLGGAAVAVVVNPLRKVTVCLEDRSINIILEKRAANVILEPRALKVRL